MIDRQTIRLPPDSEVQGVELYLGEIHLRIWVTPKFSEATIDHHFYAFCDGEYMKHPNLSFIDTLVVSGKLWVIFEDL